MSKTYWSEKLVTFEALKYKTRSEFKQKSNGAYKYAIKNGILDDICLHMEIIGDRYNRFIYKLIFPNINSIYIGLTYNFEERKNHHMKKSSNKYVRDLLGKNEEHIWVCDKELISQNKIGDVEKTLIVEYKDNGWNVLNISNGGGLGGGYIWSNELAKIEALKYQKRCDFKEKSNGAYCYASRNKILDSICSHMEIKWTPELIKIEALKYTSKMEFKNNCNGGYYYAYRNKILKNICLHMQ
jgi:hypothetical protein